jgi:hypothetical protein
MSKTTTYYLTVIRPEGDVIHHTSYKYGRNTKELDEDIEMYLGGDSKHIRSFRLVVEDAVVRARIKGRKLYVLEDPQMKPEHQYVRVKDFYIPNGDPNDPQVNRWVLRVIPVRGNIVAVGTKPHWHPPVPDASAAAVLAVPIVENYICADCGDDECDGTECDLPQGVRSMTFKIK